MIETEEEYRYTIKRMEALTDEIERTNERVRKLQIRVQEYSNKHYPIPKPSKIEWLKYIIQNKSLKGILKSIFS